MYIVRAVLREEQEREAWSANDALHPRWISPQTQFMFNVCLHLVRANKTNQYGDAGSVPDSGNLHKFADFLLLILLQANLHTSVSVVHQLQGS